MTLTYDAFPEDDTVEIDISGEITEADIDEVEPWLRGFMQDRETVHVVEVVQDVEGAEPAALWKGLKFDGQHLSNFDRVAVVSDKDWVDPLAKAAELVTNLEVRTFPMRDLPAAREWARHGGL
jgi:hypothetical protein